MFTSTPRRGRQMATRMGKSRTQKHTSTHRSSVPSPKPKGPNDAPGGPWRHPRQPARPRTAGYTFTRSRFLLAILAIAFIASTSALLYFGLQDREVNDFHPPERSLWLAYYWMAETPFGSFGLENWRLEGINTHTAIHFARYSYYDIPLSAPAVAAIAFAASNTLAWLCIATWSICHCRWLPQSSFKLRHFE